MPKRKLYHYRLADGRYITSANCLDYATTDGGTYVCLDKLSEGDSLSVSILANPLSDILLREMGDSPDKWLPAKSLLQMPWAERVSTSIFRNCCILNDGDIYVANGEYLPLATFVETASNADLVQMLYNVAIQAALSHHKLSQDSGADK